MSLVQHVRNQNDLNNFMAQKHPYIVIDIYADWCGPCKMLAPHLERMSKDYQSKGVQFLKINTEEFQFGNINALPTIQYWKLEDGAYNLKNTVVGANVQEIESKIQELVGSETPLFTSMPPPVKSNSNASVPFSSKKGKYATYGSL